MLRVWGGRSEELGLVPRVFDDLSRDGISGFLHGVTTLINVSLSSCIGRSSTPEGARC